LEALAREPAGEATIDYLGEYSVAAAAFFMDDEEQTRTYLDRAVARAQADGRALHESVFWSSCAIVQLGYGRIDDATAAAGRATRLAELTGNGSALVWALAIKAICDAQLGHDEVATEQLERGLELGRATASVVGASACMKILGHLRLRRHDVPGALSLFLEDLRQMRRRGAEMFIAQSLLGPALALSVTGDDRTAARLLGAVSASAAAGSVDWKAIVAATRAELATRLDPVELDALLSAGAQHSPTEAADVADAAIVRELDRRG
jgi:hypothetical protein